MSRRVAQTHVGDGGENSYSTPDTGNHLPAFSPSLQPGLHLNLPVLRTTMLTAVEFFRLFFSLDLIKQVVAHTNARAWNKIGEKQHLPSLIGYGDLPERNRETGCSHYLFWFGKC